MPTPGEVASTVGALSVAAVGSAVRAVQGAVTGFSEGLGTDDPSTPLVVLGVVFGAAGLIDWPILLAGGTAALLLQHYRRIRDVDASAVQPISRIPIILSATDADSPTGRPPPCS